MTPPVGVGIVGCGVVAGDYLRGAEFFDEFEVLGVTDVDAARCRDVADQYGLQCALTLEDLLSWDDVSVVLNLTPPRAHAHIIERSLDAGKHTYTEKPLAVHLEDGRRLLEFAARRHLLLGSAPDTFLGSAHRLSQRLLMSGAIGRPLAAAAFTLGPGHESWHPSPEFFYREGGGPLLDMGPYYLTILVNLLGAVECVQGMATQCSPERSYMDSGGAVCRIPVETATHIQALLRFTGGCVATLIASFDVSAHSLPYMEVYGEEGTLVIPNPNDHAGTVVIRRRNTIEEHKAPVTNRDRRGLGVADLCLSIADRGRPHTSADLAYHVLEVMTAVLTSSDTGREVPITSTWHRPETMDAAD